MEDMNTYKNINRRRGCKGVARILLCAAFLISHFSFLISLTSCSDDLIDKTSSEVDEYLLMRGYNEEQIKMQRLGYAYNAAGNVMDDGSFSAMPIINMNLLSKPRKSMASSSIPSVAIIQRLTSSAVIPFRSLDMRRPNIPSVKII